MDDYDYNDFDEFIDYQKTKRAQKFRRFVGVLVLTVGSAITVLVYIVKVKMKNTMMKNTRKTCKRMSLEHLIPI